MRINNNIMAINAHRQLGINNNKISGSIEKLSSGMRINRAGDDAAGLAISEKMRAQIRGLSMASKNSQDAISLIQTAEGALQETHNILQKMRELAVQSASDTQEQTIDRDAIQREFQQLKAEIDEIADKTIFNDQKLIDGTFASRKLTSGVSTNLAGTGMQIQIGNAAAGTYGFDIIVKTEVEAVSGQKPDKISIDNSSLSKTYFSAGGSSITLGQSGSSAAQLNGNYTLSVETIADDSQEKDGLSQTIKITATGDNGQKFETTVKLNNMNLTATTGNIVIDFGEDAFSMTLNIKNALGTTSGATALQSKSAIETTAEALQGIRFTVSGGVNEVEEKTAFYAKYTGGGEDIRLEVGMDEVTFDNGVTFKFDKLTYKDLDTTNLTAGDTLGSISAALGTGAASASTTITEVFGTTASTVHIVSESNQALVVQTGSNQGDELAINVDKMDAAYLGVKGANVSTRLGASKAITQVNDAINQVSTQRAALGALQNRLNHKIANLDTSAENLQAAESRIRDVDMAKEMTTFMKNNILSQASTAMLAQANSLPQGVLQLLG